jgi:DNA-binding NarL/FixJ family response regulator
VTGTNGKSPIRVMLVADQPAFMGLMEALLSRQQDLEVVARAESLAEARSDAQTVAFDVVALDLGLPDGNGVDLIPDLRGSNPKAAVLVVSASLDPAAFDGAAAAGADEVMDKFAPLEDLLYALRRLGSA